MPRPNIRGIMVKVTQEDIDAGCEFRPLGREWNRTPVAPSLGFGGYSNNCPVARAIVRRTSNTYVSVGHLFITVFSGNRLHESHKDMRSPRSVYRFIEKFDNGGPVKPFAFLLNVR